ncbi:MULTISPECIES: hypothetical protein [unclassified Sinorhizobium]|uniref:hypothetical protein n=1 Tax=unclassified Sinorhizobium TaxID=2613772 RepID=UPI0024C36B69|nr:MULTISPECIES: hypothetical protein [unclassified Sinorhizobium]MDK1373381.1 hypothetical protein [Sinorhizobium sp. 6-70]MDK1481148.1 hypothetical protein [Sinorhizobium sp. 6-117]
MSDWKRSLGPGAPTGKVERRALAVSNAGHISPEDARAYAESLLQGALYGRQAYSPEGLRKPLGRLSKEPWSDDAYAAGPRVGLSGLQRNLEEAKTELKHLVPKVSNNDGVSALNGIISSIQATQNRLDDDERKGVFDEPYKNEPNLYKEHEPTFEKFGEPSGRFVDGAESSWDQGKVRSGKGPSMTLKQALLKWAE